VRAGNYTIRVEVKASNSTNSYDSSMDLSYSVNGLYKVFVDPGHGGSEPGAVAVDGSYEKVNNLSMGLKLRDLLSAYGFEVKMTRDDDSYIDFHDRAPIANAWNASIFVSIHQNTFSDPSVNGIETWFYPGSIKGQNLAAKVQNRLIKNTEAADRGAKSNDYTVLADTNMPAVLVEAGFVSNEQELSKLNNNTYQNIIANSIFGGVMDYYGMQMEDVNKDSTVDIMDLASIAKNYNTKTNSSALEKYMDINNDGVIDIYDMVLISRSIK
jgi:N-acetylmuramoyl-L-alanine amidase CwlD